jgi:serine phosphatase RsbU (regulator of sigma subunit)
MGSIEYFDNGICLCQRRARFSFALFRKNRLIQRTPSTGTLLGIYKESQYTAKTVKIETGDRLYFYSDGLLDYFEALYKCEDGYKFLKEYFKSKNNDSPANIVKELAKSVNNSGECATDDITLTVIQIK